MRSLRRKNLHRLLSGLAALILLSACGDRFDTRTTYALGTLVSITAPESADDAVTDASKLFTELQTRIDGWEASVNDAPVNEPVPVPTEFIGLLDTARTLHNLTDGRFDITVAALARAYGFPEGPFHLVTEAERAAIVPLVDFSLIAYSTEHVVKKAPVTIHTGAFAKGWVVDEAVELLKNAGVEAALVNAGGDIRAIGSRGSRPWRIAIRHPDTTEEYLGVISLDDQSVATSGDYERYFETDNGTRITHIFDAQTLAPANHWKSVSVVAETCETADGLATAYWLMDEADIRRTCEELGTPVMLMAADGTVSKMCGWRSLEP